MAIEFTGSSADGRQTFISPIQAPASLNSMPRVRIGPALPDQKILDVEIARLRDLDVEELRGRWHKRSDGAAPSPAPASAVSHPGLSAAGRSVR